MAFTEFYVQTTGSNLNAGSTTADAAVYTSPANGGWNSTTGVFTPVSGDPSATVAVGHFASIYLDAATVAVFVARVTAVSATTITVSLTDKSGTAPTTLGTGHTCKVGGAWRGPNAAVAFPFGFVQGTMMNAAGDFPRVNLKGGTNYAITAAMTHANAGPTHFQGYTTTIGDGGRFTIDGGTAGASYILLTLSGTDCDLCDAIFQNNGATGFATGVSLTGSRSFASRVVVSSVMGSGLSITASASVAVECEAFECNQSNTASSGGIIAGTNTSFVRCIAHHNAGSNNAGFVISTTGTPTMIRCIAHANGSHGISALAAVFGTRCVSCELYDNGGDGLRLANTSGAAIHVESCNFLKNGGWGINGSGAGTRNGMIISCGFGSGTQANTSGTTTGDSAVQRTDSVTYVADVTPWVAPATGDFRVILATAKRVGRGTFTQTQAGYTGTVGYPDIGAAQHSDTDIAAALSAFQADIDAIKTKTDFHPSVTAGASGGLFIAGQNAATGITTALTANIVGNITGNLSGSVGSIAAAGITAASFAAGAIDAAAIATDAIGSSELAASAVTKIQVGLSTLDAAGIRSAVGLSAANLDTQLGLIYGVIDTEVASIFSRLGAPAGASIAADIAAAKVDTAAILDNTGTSGVVVVAGSKTGYELSATGLDAITATTPTGVATTFPQKVNQLWARFLGRVTKSATEIKTYRADGTTVATTQGYTSVGASDDVGSAT